MFTEVVRHTRPDWSHSSEMSESLCSANCWHVVDHSCGVISRRAIHTSCSHVRVQLRNSSTRSFAIPTNMRMPLSHTIFQEATFAKMELTFVHGCGFWRAYLVAVFIVDWRCSQLLGTSPCFLTSCMILRLSAFGRCCDSIAVWEGPSFVKTRGLWIQ